MPKANPWIDRYSHALDDKTLRTRAVIRASPFELRKDESVESACKRLRTALKSVFVLTDGTLGAIRSELERALAHAEDAYGDPACVLRQLYSCDERAKKALGDPNRNHEWPIMITGLAGVGKTHLQAALSRILDGSVAVDLGEAHGTHTLEAYRRYEFNERKSRKGLLEHFARPLDADWSLNVTVDDLPARAAGHLFRKGVCLIGIDELQFMAQSDNAVASVTSALFSVSAIGRPWHCSANYSLIWKLIRRPQEITQRFLDRPIVLFPDLPDSAGWLELLDEYGVVIEPISTFKPRDRANDLWNLTVAIKRGLVALICSAYAIALKSGRQKIDWADIDSAYTSAGYTSYRDDVEKLIAHETQGVALPEHLDCPFKSGTISVASANFAAQIKKIRRAQFVKSAAEAGLTKPEKENLQTVLELVSGGQQTMPAKPGAPRREKATLEQLQAGGARLRDR